MPRLGAVDRIDVDDVRGGGMMSDRPPGDDAALGDFERDARAGERELDQRTHAIVGTAEGEHLGECVERRGRHLRDPEDRTRPAAFDREIGGSRGQAVVGNRTQRAFDHLDASFGDEMIDGTDHPHRTHAQHHDRIIVATHQSGDGTAGTRPFVGLRRQGCEQTPPADSQRFVEGEVGPRDARCGSGPTVMWVTRPDSGDVQVGVVHPQLGGQFSGVERAGRNDEAGATRLRGGTVAQPDPPRRARAASRRTAFGRDSTAGAPERKGRSSQSDRRGSRFML